LLHNELYLLQIIVNSKENNVSCWFWDSQNVNSYNNFAFLEAAMAYLWPSLSLHSPKIMAMMHFSRTFEVCSEAW
jgi:hypothetical protein